MQSFKCFNSSRICCKSNVFILAFIWIFGLLFGYYLSCSARTVSSSLMYAAVCRPVSIVGLAVMNFLPIILSAFAVYFSVPFLIELVFFLESFSLGYCLCGVILAFCTSGWLILLLLMFSQLGINILLWGSILSYRVGSSKRFMRCLLIRLSAATIISLIDYTYISPFLVKVINLV